MIDLRRLIAIAGVTLCTDASFAEVVSRKVGVTEINLAVPAGFCVLDSGNYRDALFISTVTHFLQGTNKLILLSADCAVLEKWRSGDNSGIRKYAVYYTPNAFENLTLPGAADTLRKGLCQEMRQQGESTVDAAKALIAEKAKAMSSKLAVNNVNYIGVVAEDEHACYSTFLLGLKDGGGNDVMMSGVITSTIMRAKPIFIGIYDSYQGPETLQAGVDRSKVVAAELEASNR